MVIWKFELKIQDRQRIRVGDWNAKPLAVGLQNGKLMMWVHLDEDCAAGGNCELVINIIGTGNLHDESGDYIGTAIMPNGLVWHVFLGGVY